MIAFCDPNLEIFTFLKRTFFPWPARKKSQTMSISSRCVTDTKRLSSKVDLYCSLESQIGLSLGGQCGTGQVRKLPRPTI